LWCWSLNSVPWTCQISTLSLEPCPILFLFWLFFRCVLVFFIGTGLMQQSSYLYLPHCWDYKHKPPCPACWDRVSLTFCLNRLQAVHFSWFSKWRQTRPDHPRIHMVAVTTTHTNREKNIGVVII
jgi:hypothetical protein